LVPVRMRFQAVKEPRAESPAAGRGNHEDAGDLGDVAGQQAQPGAPSTSPFSRATSSRPRGGVRSSLGSSLMTAAIRPRSPDGRSTCWPRRRSMPAGSGALPQQPGT
jgi:hypothetical protein